MGTGTQTIPVQSAHLVGHNIKTKGTVHCTRKHENVYLSCSHNGELDWMEIIKAFANRLLHPKRPFAHRRTFVCSRLDVTLQVLTITPNHCHEMEFTTTLKQVSPQNIFPSRMFQCLALFGLYPTDDKRRLKKFLSRAQLLYWIICVFFMLCNFADTCYILAHILFIMKLKGALLQTLVEVLFFIEFNRGIVFCVILAIWRQKDVKHLIHQVEELADCFTLFKATKRRVRRVVVTLAMLILFTEVAIDTHTIVTWYIVHGDTRVHSIPVLLYTILPKEIVIASFSVLCMVPEFLSRIALVLTTGSGFILLACLKLTKDRCRVNARIDGSSSDTGDLRKARKQCYVLANTLVHINTNLGGLMAFLLLTDFAVVCGCVTRLLFSLPDPFQISQTLATTKNVYLIVNGLAVKMIGTYWPFILLHKEVSGSEIFPSWWLPETTLTNVLVNSS